MKIIRNKQTGFSEGYGFVEFVDRATAEHALKTLNGTPMPSAHQMFRLNWASFGVGGGASGASGASGGANDHSVFVGDLPPEVNDLRPAGDVRGEVPVRAERAGGDGSQHRSE